MKNKSRIVDLLKGAPKGVKSMTVEGLVKKLSKELKKEKEDDEFACYKVCNIFKDTYIKVRDEECLFGLQVDYIHIKDIKIGSMTTDWERLFDISGQRVFFSSTFVNSKDMKMGEVHNSMTAKKLNAAEKITEEEFQKARWQFDVVQDIIKRMQEK